MAIFDRESLVQQLQRHWAFGERFVLAWTLARDVIQVLLLPRDAYLELRRSNPLSWTQPLAHTPDAWAALRAQHAESARVVRCVCAGALGRSQRQNLDALIARYAVTLSPPRPVLLFDLAGFTLLGPTDQLLHLAALERALSEAEDCLTRHDHPLALRRTTTGDGFYVWDDAPTAPAESRLLALLLLTIASFRRQGAELGFGSDALKVCAGIGRYWHMHRIEHGQPQADGYIVGEITIELARLMAECAPGHVLLALGHQGQNLPRLAKAVVEANRWVRLCDSASGQAIQAKLAAKPKPGGGLAPAVQLFRAKHGWVYRALELALRCTAVAGPDRTRSAPLAAPRG